MSFVVLYFYQGEPGEALETPNCFPLPKGSNPSSPATYGQFLDRFPPSARRGQMHFRFKEDDRTYGYVWKDVTDRQAPLPMSRDGVITCKILCVDVAHTQRRYTRLRLKKSLDSGAEGAADYLKSRELAAFSVPKGLPFGGRRGGNGDAAAAGSPSSSSSSSSSKGRPSRYADDDDDDDEVHDGDEGGEERAAASSSGRSAGAASFVPSSPGQQQRGAAASSSGRNGNQAVGNLLDGDAPGPPPPAGRAPAPQNRGGPPQHTPAPAAAAQPHPHAQAQRQAAPSAGTNKANASSSSGGGGNRQAAASAPAPAPSPAPAPPPPPAEPVLSREELAARREAQVEENVENALREKQERDERQRKETDALDEARAKHDKNLTNWQTVNKEKRNVRNLLTTMHTVLWEDSNWKALSLGDVIEPGRVKFHYRKAMLVVHPDKVVDQSPERQFIAKRIFEGLNEAYKLFEEKELS